jgi:hypothetical protein
MPIRTALWKVNAKPEHLVESSLAKEQLLEEMIVAAPKLLSDEWMLIGRQEDTGYGGRIDLLAIAPDGSLVLVELKRDRTPRDVVAQALDYAAWVEKLKPEEISAIYRRFKKSEANLAADFQNRFGVPLDEESINETHQIIIVAASLSESSERIVSYLNERDIPINVLCFQVFSNGAEQIISRSWLLDPVQTQSHASIPSSNHREPWNGEFYCSYGDSYSRSWEDAVEFGFICGGGAPWYSKTLQLLAPGDRVWVKVPGRGFVGVGLVTGRSQAASSFKVVTKDGEFPVTEIAKRANYHAANINDPETCEYFVPIRWLDTVTLEKAVQEIGLFGNQNTVCKPTAEKWRSTVDRLKTKFKKYDAA